MLFNRSWYNCTGVERVMGSASDEYALFPRQAPGSVDLVELPQGAAVDGRRRRRAPGTGAVIHGRCPVR